MRFGFAVLTAFLLCVLAPVAWAAPPVMEGISPTSGRGGSITIYGKGFTTATAVHVGSFNAPFTASENQIKAHAYEALPPGTVAPVSVSNAEGTSAYELFTYFAQAALAWSGMVGEPIREGAKYPTFAWGTLTFQSATQTATCRVAEGGKVSILNPESAEYDALGETVRFLPYECLSSTCPTPRVTASGLSDYTHWSQRAEGSPAAEEYGERYEGMSLTLEYGQSSEQFTGTQSTSWVNGITAGKPSERIMRASSLGGLTIKGRMKIENYERFPVSTLTVGATK